VIGYNADGEGVVKTDEQLTAVSGGRPIETALNWWERCCSRLQALWDKERSARHATRNKNVYPDGPLLENLSTRPQIVPMKLFPPK